MLDGVSRSTGAYIWSGIVLLVNTAITYGLLVIINGIISGEPARYFPEYQPVIFVLFVIALVACQRFVQLYLTRQTNSFMFDAELMILNKIRSSSYTSFEMVGSERIYTALEDIGSLAGVPVMIVTVINSATVAIGGFSCMLWISPKGGLAIFLLVSLLVVTYLKMHSRLLILYRKLRDLQDRFYRQLGDLIGGFREIKLNAGLSDRIYNQYAFPNRENTRVIKDRLALINANINTIGNYSPFILIGSALFLFEPLIGMQRDEIILFVMVLLFTISPLSDLVGVIPNYPRIKVTLKRIAEFRRELLTEDECKQTTPLEQATIEFQSLRFEDVCYRYEDTADTKSFVFGPVSAEFSRGEIVFISGGNGSGKSTFVKLLTGMHKPTSGKIFLDNILIPYDNYQVVKERISAIFSDNYLFRTNYMNYDISAQSEFIVKYLKMMELTRVAKFHTNDESVSFDIRLSRGQQKRIAFIYALLEEKPVIVLDEWAAEQDPVFREYFYTEILQFLRSIGKTVVSVTHDDRYYGRADRVIKFNFGRIQGEYAQAVV
jgi:ABC-type siderophore export system fused ATPase/permease subunit